MVEANAQEDAQKMSKTVSVNVPNVRGGAVLALALEADETTIKVSVGVAPGCETFVRATDLIEAARLFEAAVPRAR